MGARKENQPHDDQQNQEHTEGLTDAEHASISPETFARRPPTSEDLYFFEKQHAHLLQNEAKKLSDEEKSQQTEYYPKTIWQRITRAVSRGFNINWRP